MQTVFELCSPDRVKMLGHIDEAAIDLMGRLDRFNVISQANIEFDIEQYPVVLAHIKDTAGLVVDEIPPYVYNQILASQRRPVIEPDWTRIPQRFADMLAPHQREGVRFGLSCGGRFLLADGMGLGKTYQAIAFAMQFPGPYLIVAPKSLINQWKAAIQSEKKAHIDVPVHIIEEQSDASLLENLDPHPNVFYVLSYELAAGFEQVKQDKTKAKPLAPKPFKAKAKQVAAPPSKTRVRKAIENTAWGVAIMDESDKMRSIETNISNMFCLGPDAVLRRTPQVCIISGTPQHSVPKELYPQLCALFPDFDMDYFAFTRRYCGGEYDFNRWKARDCLHEYELSSFLKTRMIRRREEDLPSNTVRNIHRRTVYLRLDDEQRAKYAAFQAEYDAKRERYEKAREAASKNGSEWNKRMVALAEDQRNSARTKLQRDLCSLKAPLAAAHIAANLRTYSSKGKVIVFTHYNDTRAAIHAALASPGREVLVIDGSTTSKLRESRRLKLCTDDDADQVGILSMHAAGVGGDYVPGCSTCFFTDLDFSVEMHAQSEKRLHRMGAERDVQCVTFVVPGTIDDEILASHRAKRGRNIAIIDGGGIPSSSSAPVPPPPLLATEVFGDALLRTLIVQPTAIETLDEFISRAGCRVMRNDVDLAIAMPIRIQRATRFADAGCASEMDSDVIVFPSADELTLQMLKGASHPERMLVSERIPLVAVCRARSSSSS